MTSIKTLQYKLERKIKRKKKYAELKRNRKPASMFAGISNNIGEYFNAVTKVDLVPYNQKIAGTKRAARTMYQVVSGTRGIVFKNPPTVRHEIHEDIYGNVSTKMRITQRYTFYLTKGYPVENVKDLLKFQHFKCKLGEMIVNFDKNKIVLK